jgi:predicted nucleotidyltransferase
MKTTILQTLKNIEAEKNITILFACETGSRAWGFPSPDSDYDIRFIYKHNLDWYLSLSEKKDSIEIMLNDGDLDLNGWDIKKCLQLLTKSNAALIERFTSPIIYFEQEEFKNEFVDLIHKNYNRLAVFHHHYSLAKGFWQDIKDADKVKLKGLFYLIRSLLSCKYLVANNTVAPMHIFGLMDTIDTELKENIKSLIALKATVNEKFLYKKELWISNWIANTFAELELIKENIPISKNDFASLDHYFKKIIK